MTQRRFTMGFAVLLGGCMPLVNHAPHVESGRSRTLTSAIAVASGPPLTWDSAAAPPFPLVSYRESIAWRPKEDPDRIGVEAALEASLLNGLVADLYVQGPSALPLNAGAGVQLVGGPFSGSMAYLQLGHQVAADYYLFTTQSAAWLRRSNDGFQNVWWQPTLALEWKRRDEPPGRGRRFYAFLGMTVGPPTGKCSSSTNCPWVLPSLARATVGVSIIRGR